MCPSHLLVFNRSPIRFFLDHAPVLHLFNTLVIFCTLLRLDTGTASQDTRSCQQVGSAAKETPQEACSHASLHHYREKHAIRLSGEAF